MVETPVKAPNCLPKNRLLRQLSADELRRLSPSLESVELKPRQILHHWNMPIDHVYFLEGGLVSVAARTGSSESVEVWLIGSDGLVGMPALLADHDAHPHRRIVQLGGTALRASTKHFRESLEAFPGLRTLVLKYVQVVLIQTSQCGACNSRHSLRQRLARWLLVARDCLVSDELPLTHQVLARLLGVRRASVTECLAMLEGEACLENTRAFIHIRPDRLEQVSCICYRIIRAEYNRLFG